MNAWLSRRQHVREIHHEARVLRAALKAELEVIREAFNDRIEIINNAGTSRSMLVPLDTMTDVYASLINRIGFLSERETRAVVRAYVLVRQMPERIKVLSRQHGTQEEREVGWANVDGQLFGALKKLHENYLTDIEAALVEVDRHLT
jgi:hypothetical protein